MKKTKIVLFSLAFTAFLFFNLTFTFNIGSSNDINLNGVVGVTSSNAEYGNQSDGGCYGCRYWTGIWYTDGVEINCWSGWNTCHNNGCTYGYC